MTTAATDRLNDRMDAENGFGNGHDDSPLAVLNRTEIDQQVATAKRYPRSIARSKQKMIEMAQTDEETAQGCIYTLKRKDKETGQDVFIEGPSVRLAEIAVHAWGNIRAGARVIGEENGSIVAQGVCHDLESNTFTSIEVRRRITTKKGYRYSDDMIGVTANAACAIAFRNAVYKIVPKVYVMPAYNAAQKLVAGDAKSIGQRRQALVAYFSKMHIDLAQIMAFIEKPDGGLDDITGEDLVRLHGVATAIRDGDTTIDEAFPQPDKPRKPEQSTGGGAADLNAQLDAGKGKAKDPYGQPIQTPAPVKSEEEADRIIREKAAQARGANVPAGGQPDSAPAPAPNTNPAPEGGGEKPKSGAFPDVLPDSARTSRTLIDDAIKEHKGERTAHAARKRFHEADLREWEKLPPERQDEKYAALLRDDWGSIVKK